MKLITVNTALLKTYSADTEFLHKKGRPCALILHLRYKGKRHDFAIPLRSNIPATAPKEQYFALPPRPTTKPKNRHGLHYIKMFPVSKKYFVQFRTEGNSFATLISNILIKHEKEIIIDCQKYLDDYAAGIHPLYSTNIDFLLQKLNEDNT